jgi:hypothetical protein
MTSEPQTLSLEEGGLLICGMPKIEPLVEEASGSRVLVELIFKCLFLLS